MTPESCVLTPEDHADLTETDYLTTENSFVFPPLFSFSAQSLILSPRSLRWRFVLAVSEINDVFPFNCGAPGCCDLITKCLYWGRHPDGTEHCLAINLVRIVQNSLLRCWAIFSVMEQMLDESQNDGPDLQLSSSLSIIRDVIAIWIIIFRNRMMNGRQIASEHQNASMKSI